MKALLDANALLETLRGARVVELDLEIRSQFARANLSVAL